MQDMGLFANASVDAEVAITLHTSALPENEYVSILFGKERITLSFFDVESLERLRDLAQEGARRLRAAIDANDRSDTAGCGIAAVERPAELVSAGGRSA